MLSSLPSFRTRITLNSLLSKPNTWGLLKAPTDPTDLKTRGKSNRVVTAGEYWFSHHNLSTQSGILRTWGSCEFSFDMQSLKKLRRIKTGAVCSWIGTRFSVILCVFLLLPYFQGEEEHCIHECYIRAVAFSQSNSLVCLSWEWKPG